MEEIVQVGGHIRNASFTDSLLPTFLDMPDVVATLVEEPDPHAPLGARAPASRRDLGHPGDRGGDPDALRQAGNPRWDLSPDPGPPGTASRDRAVGAEPSSQWALYAPGVTEREIMSWADFGTASRDVAQMVADDGYEPDMILAIAGAAC